MAFANVNYDSDGGLRYVNSYDVYRESIDDTLKFHDFVRFLLNMFRLRLLDGTK